MRTFAQLQERTSPRSGRSSASRLRSASSEALLQLQRTVGNQAVQRWLGSSATLGPSGDRNEQEADRVAAGDGVPKGTFDGPSLPSRGGGDPLAQSDRAYFESRFAASFATVRVHHGGDAARAADAIGARGFTAGNDIAFADGQYRPGSEEGRHLLAHELTHHLQQRTNGVAVQADFWDTLGRGWSLYWNLSDEGALYARSLMEHYLLGIGDFDADSRSDPGWNTFMLGRPEIQRAMRPVFAGIAQQVAPAGPTEKPWFRWGAGPHVEKSITAVKLNELESMRLTLHGCHRIDIYVSYDVNDLASGGIEVVFTRIHMTWVDVGDMHPGTETELKSGERVDDSELTAAGSSFNIFIEFSPRERTVFHVVKGVATQISGWPPVPGTAAPAGKRK